MAGYISYYGFDKNVQKRYKKVENVAEYICYYGFDKYVQKNVTRTCRVLVYTILQDFLFKISY